MKCDSTSWHVVTYFVTTTYGRSFFTKIKRTYLILAAITLYLIYYLGLPLHLLEVNYNRFSYPLDIPMMDVLTAIRKGKTPAYEPINKFTYPYRIGNDKKCTDLEGNYEKVVILYVIKSALNHEDRRDAIRKSWGWENRFSDVTIRRVFLLGITHNSYVQDQINEEYAKNKDMVQAEFIDSYYNNTIKTMMGFKWVVENCPKAQFIMFSDDDMYISTKNLLKFIRNPFNKRVGFRRRREISNIVSSTRHLFSGVSVRISNDKKKSFRKIMEMDPMLSAFDGRLFAGFVFSSSPMRHKFSKWYVSLNEYPYSKYPPYVTAGAYVLSYPALEDLYYISMYTKPFRFDDIYLGILAKKGGISPLHNEHFHFWKKPYSQEDYSNVIASHGYGDPKELKKVWDEQRSLGHA